MNPAIFRSEGVQNFDELARKYQRIVWSVAYRFLRNADDALDVTQEVLLRLHQWLPRLGRGEALNGWICRTTTNAALNFSRASAVRERYHQAAGSEAARQIQPAAGRSELAHAIEKAIKQLPRQQRAIVTLRLLEGNSFREIARTFGVADGTVKVQFARAMRRMRKQLAEWKS